MAQGDSGLGRTSKLKASGRYNFEWGKPEPEAPEQVIAVEIKDGSEVRQRWELQDTGEFLCAVAACDKDVAQKDLRFRPHQPMLAERGKGVVEKHLWPRGYEWGNAQEASTVRQLGRRANIDTGDFVAELSTVMRTRHRYGLAEGEFIEDVERVFTDGQVFGEEERRPTDVQLQITVSMDRSKSTFANGVARIGGRAFIALDKTVRQAALDLPEGCLTYQPFTFAGGATRETPEGVRRYNGQWWLPSDDWADTRITPLFRAIQRWEQTVGNPDAFKLDIVITDGVLEHRKDVAEANRIQVERNGRGAVVMLNFLPREEWGDYHMPSRTVMYEVTEDNLAARLRTVIAEVLGDLL